MIDCKKGNLAAFPYLCPCGQVRVIADLPKLSLLHVVRGCTEKAPDKARLLPCTTARVTPLSNQSRPTFDLTNHVRQYQRA